MENKLKSIYEKTERWEKEFLKNTVLPKYEKIGEYCDENNLNKIRNKINNVLMSSYKLGRTEIQAYRDLIQVVKNNPITYNNKKIRRILIPSKPF